MAWQLAAARHVASADPETRGWALQSSCGGMCRLVALSAVIQHVVAEEGSYLKRLESRSTVYVPYCGVHTGR